MKNVFIFSGSNIGGLKNSMFFLVYLGLVFSIYACIATPFGFSSVSLTIFSETGLSVALDPCPERIAVWAAAPDTISSSGLISGPDSTLKGHSLISS